MNVVIYARFSSHSQTEQSIEGQLKVCYEYAESNNYTVVGEYIDRAQTGKNDHRFEFQKMLADSEKHTFEGVLVYQLDRFARNRYDSAINKAKLKRNGVRVISAKENIADDPSGILVEGVLESMAEYYSAELSQKINRGMEINAEKCLSNGSNPGLGYKVDSDRRFYVDPDEALIVREIFERYATGETKADIIRDLQRRRIKTSIGKEFSPNSLSRNTYHVVTELTYRNDDDEFRPDITLLINGLPLAFTEVKKPNNRDGIIAEHNRIQARFSTQVFRRFVNITQLMVFSNNMEYDDTEVEPVEGAFYASSSYEKLFFNRFREEDPSIHTTLPPIDPAIEDEILKDNNLVSIKGTQEYAMNLEPTTPTNRILTSLFSHKRFLKLLKYGFAYVERTDRNGIKFLQKHIMRYPQFFATMAIEKKLNSGVHNGIIWHTQGSGKTALAFHNVRYLRDYYQKQGKIAKFYFIVDRLDLLTQASEEFAARGLHVDKVNSKEDFIKNIRTIGNDNLSGKDSITVVNIQKFSTEAISRKADYDVNVQRIYFLDEAHRSYYPKGSFLANLMNSDREAVMIALTGTPLIGEGYNTKDVFGDYIHKYYYNRSIADGYTLKLIREGIRTEYRTKMQSVLNELETRKGSLKKKDVYAHPKYVEALVEYIVDDFKRSRIALGDSTIGGMIVCDSSDQARTVEEKLNNYPDISHVLILHDVDDKETRRHHQDDFKKGKIDLLVVYNMLLTGFDAPRLKKQYLGRVIKQHNLLQTLTRVNRPYKSFRYGYVVDFADIRAEFDKTNKAYFEELQAELGDEFERYRDIFMSQEEIEQSLTVIQNKLFLYSTDNAELFSRQINALDDKQELLDLRKALDTYKELLNIMKLFGYDELAQRFSMDSLHAMSTEVNNRIALVNLKQNMQDGEDVSGLLNLAFDQIEFHFTKVSESELVIADKFQDILERTRQEIQRNLDPKDPEYVTLLEELKRIFKKKNIEELTADEMTKHIQELERIRKAAAQQNLRDQMLLPSMAAI